MLHRTHHAFKIVAPGAAEPADLPNVIREDLFLLAPVDPIRLFATWHISYTTQNRLRDYIGEDDFDGCRLMLSLKGLDEFWDDITVDVSGPGTSTTINIEGMYAKHQNQRRSRDFLRLYGELSYRCGATSYYITRSKVTVIPRLSVADVIDEQFPPLEPLYERLYRRLDAQAIPATGRPSLLYLGSLVDKQLGLDVPLQT